jgi:hypothetical protein
MEPHSQNERQRVLLRTNAVKKLECAKPQNAETKQPLRFCQGDRLFTELVRRRAYELYVQRGMEDGHAEEDWLRAEEETPSEDKKPIAAAA